MSDLEVIAIKPLAGLTPQMSIGWAGCKKGRENGSHLSLVALEISLANEPNPMDGPRKRFAGLANPCLGK